jgi:hypothetical protein
MEKKQRAVRLVMSLDFYPAENREENPQFEAMTDEELTEAVKDFLDYELGLIEVAGLWWNYDSARVEATE